MSRSICLVGTLALFALCNAWAGPLYNGLSGWAITSDPALPGSPFQPAFSFVPGATVDFTELDIALSAIFGNNSVIVDLMSDSGGLPGTVLESWNVGPLPPAGAMPLPAPQVLLGDGAIPLMAGTPYWVAALPSDNTSLATWGGSLRTMAPGGHNLAWA